MSSDVNDLIQITRGEQVPGSGGLCAMQQVSVENGHESPTHMPDCADEVLAQMVWTVNDRVCREAEGFDVPLCPACAVQVMRLARRTVGTNLAARGWTFDDRWALYQRLAADLKDAGGPVADLDVTRSLSGASVVGMAWAGAVEIGPVFLDAVHYVIDRFEELTGISAPEWDTSSLADEIDLDPEGSATGEALLVG